MKKDGSKNILIGIIGVIIVLFVMLQVVSNMTGNGGMAEADSSLPVSLAKPTADDFYKAASNAPNTAKKVVEKTEKKAVVVQKTTGVQEKKSVGALDSTKQKVNAKPAKKVQKDTPKENMVTVSIKENVGRTDPFLPAIELSTRTDSELPKLPAAPYHQPPTVIQENPEIDKLMQTTISGILYDAFAPSAIVSIEGQDHLVRKGDRINGYKILDITKNRVVVQNGTNIYRAVVGETITASEEPIIHNNVYNLRGKFAGVNADEDIEMIEIN